MINLIPMPLSITESFEVYGFEKEADLFESTTVSGWVIEQLGQLPTVGDHFEYNHVLVTVEKMEARRVLEISAVKLVEPEETAE